MGLKRLTLRWKGLPAWLLLCAMLCAAASAEGIVTDGYYDLRAIAAAGEGENAVLLRELSYYSGDMIYKGSTGRPLNGACALHCAAVLISNLKGEAVTGQQVAKANNRDIRQEKSWTPFVSWGKVASAFGVALHTENMAQFSARLKQKGVKTEERRTQKMARLVEIMQSSAMDGGLMIHFNSSGRLNGSGTHRHAVVLMGYIERDGVIVDLLINDSSVPAPSGVCVRMSESSLPVSILGQKKVDQALSRGEDLALQLMDYAVSCRWATLANE